VREGVGGGEGRVLGRRGIEGGRKGLLGSYV